MAMPSTASCCLSSSPHGRPRLTHTATAWSPARIRLVSRSAPSRNPLRLSFSSAEPAPDVAGDEGEYMDREVEEDRDERYGFEMEVRKLPGKKNRRLVRARVRVGAPLQAVWATLTDYEGLAGFIPGLSECRLLHQDKAFARLYQVGEQDLALGVKFNAKGTIDCYEGDMELLPDSGARRREIAFNMVDGDFKVFEGKWSVHEVEATSDEGREISVGQEFQTTLSYVVELEPKLWVPVRLLEGRICKEIKTNLVCIREEAERVQRLQGTSHNASPQIKKRKVTNQTSVRCHNEVKSMSPVQVGEQDLTLGLKFNSKGTIGCYKGEMELLPESGAARREIAFNMVDGDFKFFGGKWSVQEVADTTEGGEISSGQEFQTTLSYVVELEPKLCVPVRLLEGRICKEIKTNLVCIREEAEKVPRLPGGEATDTNQAV